MIWGAATSAQDTAIANSHSDAGGRREGDPGAGLLRLVDGGSYTCAEVKALTLDHAAEVRRKVADLRKLERVLKEMAAECDGGEVPECPIIDTLYRERGIRSGPDSAAPAAAQSWARTLT